MARRLTKGGHQCVVFDRNRENVNALAKALACSLEELVEKLSAPRVLPTFPEDLSAKAQRHLESLGVTIYTNTPVTIVNAY